MKKRKEEVEELVGRKLTDKEFEDALKLAKNKQKYIYENTGRSVVMQDWYLNKLTEEYVHSLDLSKLTLSLYETVRAIEKECTALSCNTPTNKNIVHVSV